MGWLRAIEDKRYADAAIATHKYSSGEGGDKKSKKVSLDLTTAETMLSIGKLCGWVNMLDVAAGHIEGETGEDVRSATIVDNLDISLLTVKAQECLLKYAKPEDR